MVRCCWRGRALAKNLVHAAWAGVTTNECITIIVVVVVIVFFLFRFVRHLLCGEVENFHPHRRHREYMKRFDVYFRAVILYTMCKAVITVATINFRTAERDDLLPLGGLASSFSPERRAPSPPPSPRGHHPLGAVGSYSLLLLRGDLLTTRRHCCGVDHCPLRLGAVDSYS